MESGTTHNPRVPEFPPTTSKDSTNAQLLAMLLDGLVRNRRLTLDHKSRYRKDVWFASALAVELNYRVDVDDVGWIHIWLPTFQSPSGGLMYNHIRFHIGINNHADYNPVTDPEIKWTIDAYFEAVMPKWQRERIASVRADQEGAGE